MRRFAITPDVYMPLFGGYDVLAVARGATVPGNPRYWAVVNRWLYLFESVYAAAMRDYIQGLTIDTVGFIHLQEIDRAG